MSRFSNEIAFDYPIPSAWADQAPVPEARSVEVPAMPDVDERGISAIRIETKRDKSRVHVCASCGEQLDPDSDGHEVVRRVVKPRCSYGDARPGDVVDVEPRHLAGPVIAMTFSLDEYRAHLEKQRAAVPPPKPKGRLAAAVDAMLEPIAAQTRAAIERGKERLARTSGDEEVRRPPAAPLR